MITERILKNMGQYYMPTLKDETGKIETLYSHDFNNGLKLMEHSYIGNNFVSAVCDCISNEPKRVWWLGDYAETDDFYDKYSENSLSDAEMAIAWEDKSIRVRPDEVNQTWVYGNHFLINLDQKCYVKFNDVNDDFQICPLPILTAVGSGRGGGDYFGTNMELVGTWAGDMLLISDSLKDSTKDYSDFQDCTEECFFSEQYQL